jgi:hypothetical protein
MESEQHRVPAWPSGVVAFDGQTLELSAAKERIPREDLRELSVEQKAGRLSLTVSFQRGLGTHKSGVWVTLENGDDLRKLLAAAEAASGAKLNWD